MDLVWIPVIGAGVSSDTIFTYYGKAVENFTLTTLSPKQHTTYSTGGYCRISEARVSVFSTKKRMQSYFKSKLLSDQVPRVLISFETFGRSDWVI